MKKKNNNKYNIKVVNKSSNNSNVEAKTIIAESYRKFNDGIIKIFNALIKLSKLFAVLGITYFMLLIIFSQVVATVYFKILIGMGIYILVMSTIRQIYANMEEEDEK